MPIKKVVATIFPVIILFSIIATECFSAVTPHPVSLYSQGKKILNGYRGNPDELKRAEELFLTLINRYPQSPLGYLGMSQLKTYYAYFYDMDFNMKIIHEEVMPYAVKALELGPTLQEVHENYGFVEKIFTEYQNQKKELEKLVTLKPRDPETFFRMGLFVLKQNEFIEAEKYFKTSLTLQPTLKTKLRILKRLGWLNLLYLNNPQKAVDYYGEALVIHDTSEVSEYLGIAYFKAGQYEKAVDQLIRGGYGIRNNQTKYYLLLSKARTLLEKNKINEATRYFEEASQYRNLDSETHFLLGSIYFGHDDNEKAYDHFRQVIQLTPQDARAYYFAGRAVYSLGKSSIALTFFNKYLNLDPENAEIDWIRQNVPELTRNKLILPIQ
jgi:tetratricopeptide (TPR) repeat protein